MEVLMIGGPKDGERIHVADSTYMIHVARALKKNEPFLWCDEDQTDPPHIEVVVYRRLDVLGVIVFAASFLTASGAVQFLVDEYKKGANNASTTPAVRP